MVIGKATKFIAGKNNQHELVFKKYIRFITGSYDRTCKIWDTETGEEKFTLEGHKNVVYCIAFNNPFG